MSNFDYYNFRIKYVSDIINHEILFYQGSEYANIPPVSTYIDYLKARLGIDRMESTTITYYDDMRNKCEIKKMNLDEYSKDMDELVFNRPWNKLREFHKIMKIKEFVESLEYNKKVSKDKVAKNKKDLVEQICAGLKNKKFGKGKAEVVYDKDKMGILSISCLDYNKKKSLYEVDWDA